MTDLLGTRGTALSPETRLYSDGVVAGADGSPVVVPPHSTLRRMPGTALLDPATGTLPGALIATPEQIVAARATLDAADVPGQDTAYAGMARTALIDIDALTFPNGAAVAAGSPYWRYVWPRDVGFMSAALSVVGRYDAAVHQLAYVARMQESDGTWQARYLPDGSGDVPDDRGLQLDGIGWTLWATWLWARLSGSSAAALRPMIRAAVEAAIDALDPRTHLPRASQDFWEVDLTETTLGSAAPLLLGLRTGRDLLTGLGGIDDGDLSKRADVAAGHLATAITTHFAPHGYARRLSGRGGRDASVAFLLPPFAPADDDVLRAWQSTVDATTVANGGVRPGEEWGDHDTAWTPQTSLYSLTAAAVGDTALAHRLLSWLDVRRTTLGALPEKLTAAGLPAAVAPLGMTGATVVVALAALDGHAIPVPEP